MLNKPVAAAAAAVALLSAAVAPVRAEPVKNVVLVHGAFADGSGWQRVADIQPAAGDPFAQHQIDLTGLWEFDANQFGLTNSSFICIDYNTT